MPRDGKHAQPGRDVAPVDRAGVENSLRRLQTDHIDLYQQHHFDTSTAAGGDAQRPQRSRAPGARCAPSGVSNFAAERIVEAQWTSERWGYERFRCGQAAYSLFRRGIERDVLPTCQRYGMGVITWGPLDGSWLSGKFRKPEDLADSIRLRAGQHFALDPEEATNRRKLELLVALHGLADDAGIPMAHLATAFVTEHPDVTAAIIGPRTPEQLASSLEAADLRLEPALLDALDQVVTPGTDVATLSLAAAGSPAELRPAYRRSRA